MDLRKKKTRNSIYNAFITLRASKPLEKITVKELSDLAMINKATFYQHFQDIYDLSDTMENEILVKLIDELPNQEYLLTHPRESTEILYSSILAQSELIHILFSGSRQAVLMQKIETGLKRIIFERNPELKDSLRHNVILTVITQGCTRAFLDHYKDDIRTVIPMLAEIAEVLLRSEIRK